MASAPAGIRVEVVRAWPRRHEAVTVELAPGATVTEALLASAWDLADVDGYAVYGERVSTQDTLCDGDRLELLRPLQLDPKQARRRRAEAGRRP